ncbi:hypothetical protein L218DRAFT_843321, partial [Marasmius fiardii PR-910]
DAASIKAGMEEAKKQELLLSEKIACLETVIVAMKEEKSRVCKEIERYRWILRPIHRLPPELLWRIFSFTVDLSTAGDPFQTPSSLHPTGMPWVLAQVCQPWRKLALGTPSFWNPISLALPSKRATQSFLHAQAYRLNLQLHRSGDQPIDVI